MTEQRSPHSGVYDRNGTRQRIEQISERIGREIAKQAARILDKMTDDEIAKHHGPKSPWLLVRALAIAAMPAAANQYDAESLKPILRAVRRIDNARQYTLSEARGEAPSHE